MGIINGMYVKMLSNTLFDQMNDVYSAVYGACDNFNAEMLNVWRSPKARNFAEGFDTGCNELYNLYHDKLVQFINILNINIQNHNKKNDGNVSKVDESCLAIGGTHRPNSIQELGINTFERFENGDVGVKEGANVSNLITTFEKGVDNVSSTLSDSLKKIQGIAAFGDDEMSHLINSIRDIITKWTDSAKGMEANLKNELGIVDQDESNLAATNKSNWGN